MRSIFPFTLLVAMAMPALGQQNFSCNFGTTGACLGYNDKIVEKGSACFNQFTCDFKGFVCKSKFDDIVDEYDGLVRKHNDLLRRNRELADAAKEILDKNASLTTEYNGLLGRFQRLVLDYESQGIELRSANDRNTRLVESLRKPPIRSDEKKKQ